MGTFSYLHKGKAFALWKFVRLYTKGGHLLCGNLLHNTKGRCWLCGNFILPLAKFTHIVLVYGLLSIYTPTNGSLDVFFMEIWRRKYICYSWKTLEKRKHKFANWYCLKQALRQWIIYFVDICHVIWVFNDGKMIIATIISLLLKVSSHYHYVVDILISF